MTDQGIQLADVYLGTEGMLVGSARSARLIRDMAATSEREAEAQRLQRRMARRPAVVQAQIDSLNAELESEEDELKKAFERESLFQGGLAGDTARMATARGVDLSLGNGTPERKVQQ